MSLATGQRKVLVTGGGTGIGRAVAESLASQGAEVVIVGRREAPLEAVGRGFPGRVHSMAGDVTSPGFRDALLESAKKRMGGLDGIVLNAGAVAHEMPGSITEEALRSQLEVNLVAPLRLAERALTELESGGGLVVVSSTLAHRPVPTSAAYSAAKAGMLAALKSFAIAGAPRGLRFNAVLPGIVETDMVKARLDAHGAELRALHPLGRLGTPDDVAAAIVQLLGAAWTTGAEFVVDGGLLLRE